MACNTIKRMTMEQEQHIRQLYERYLDGTITGTELGELLDFFRNHGVPPGVDERMMQEIATPVNDTTDAAHQMAERVRSKILPYRPPRRLMRWLPHAAAIFMAVTVAAWIHYGDRITGEIVDRSATAGSPDSADILPGGNRATLTLADGRAISLSESQAGIVVGEGITYLDGSQLMKPQALDSRLATPNSITTPKGGTYQVTLSDGSRVWLNAGSTLSYPSRFSDDGREVFLEGEAFFAISHQRSTAGRLPFRVVTEGQAVEVLGTEFNLSAYPDEVATKTTLVEGAIQVVNLASKNVSQLRPGQQSTLRGTAIHKQDVDVQGYIAWKSGRFSFDGKPFEQVMAELGRWYDLDIVYTGPVPRQRFFGDAFRDENLSVVLKLLRSARIDYELQGRTLTIRAKE